MKTTTMKKFRKYFMCVMLIIAYQIDDKASSNLSQMICGENHCIIERETLFIWKISTKT